MFPEDLRKGTAPHGDPLSCGCDSPTEEMAIPNSPKNPILWQLGSTFVEGFVNPETLLFYIRQSHTPETCIVLSISDLADIIKVVSDRQMNARREPINAPSKGDMPF